MIDREHDLPITRRAAVLNISRGSVYYWPRPMPEADLAIMRRLAALFGASNGGDRWSSRLLPPPAARPRTFEEVVAANAQDPFHAARLARLESGESFDDPTVSATAMREVSVHPDCEGDNHWIVEWFASDGGCYVTTFDGPLAGQRARDYFGALKTGQLKVQRET